MRPIEEQLQTLVQERESRVGEQTREGNRAKKDPFQMELPTLIRRQRQQRLQRLAQEIAPLDAAIDFLIASDESLKNQRQRLCSIPGIAPVTAAKLLAQLAAQECSSARLLAASARLTPAQYRSGCYL